MHNYLLVILTCLPLAVTSSSSWSAIFMFGVDGAQTYSPYSSPKGHHTYPNGLPLDGPLQSTMVNFQGNAWILGGRYDDATTTVYIFNPNTNSTTKGPALPIKLWETRATVVGDSIVMCGGRTSVLRGPVNNCYKMTNMAWTQIENYPLEFASGGMVTLMNKTYVFGGAGDTALYNNTYMLDDSGHWVAKAAMPKAISVFGTTALTETTAIVCGGALDVSYIGDCNIYSAVTDTWTSTHSLTTPRYRTNLVKFAGRIYCVGGDTKAGGGGINVEVYDPVTGWHVDGKLADIYNDNMSVTAVSSHN